MRGSLRSFLLAQSHARSVDIIRSQNSRRVRESNDAMKTARANYSIQMRPGTCHSPIKWPKLLPRYLKKSAERSNSPTSRVART